MRIEKTVDIPEVLPYLNATERFLTAFEMTRCMWLDFPTRLLVPRRGLRSSR
jgi:hypothetical protein